MKTIKKVRVTPVTPNTGDIIDSFNTTDDKTTNAPSINAVENFVSDKFSVVTGTLSIDGSTSDIATLNYPTGFNKNNSVVISLGIARPNDNTGKGFNYYGIFSDSGDLLANAFRRRINLTDEGIKLFVENPGDSTLNIEYKIVLMKIS